MPARSQRSCWVCDASERGRHLRLHDGVGREGDAGAVEQQVELELDVLGEVVASTGAGASTSARKTMPLPYSPDDPPSHARPSGRR